MQAERYKASKNVCIFVFWDSFACFCPIDIGGESELKLQVNSLAYS